MKNKIKLGDRLISKDGDIGTVLKIDYRPDTQEQQMGIYAFWKNEKIAFWMNINEPSIEILENALWQHNHNVN